MKRLMRPRVLLSVSAIVIVAFFMLRGSGPDVTPQPFELATVHRGNLVSTVSATGTLSAVGTVEVGTQVSGIIKQVFVDFNDRVEKGDLLAFLDTESLDAAVQDAQAGVNRTEAALLQAEAEVARALAQVEQARAQRAENEAALKRNTALFEKGYLSAQEFAPLQTAAATAEASVASALAQVASSEAAVVSAKASIASSEASLAQIRKNRRNAEIRAPISGIVIQRSVDEGQTVAASFSTPTLFVIAEDLAEMEILAQVDESDIGLVEPGQPVYFTVAAHADRTFEGEVRERRLQPQTIQNVVLYTVVVSASNDDGLLLPGMTATVDFEVGGVDDALLIPVSALRFDPPDAIRTAAREAQRADTTTSLRTSKFSSDLTELWIPGEGRQMRPLLVRVLATDGSTTAIAPVDSLSGVIAPGLEVVIRMNEEENAS